MTTTATTPAAPAAHVAQLPNGLQLTYLAYAAPADAAAKPAPGTVLLLHGGAGPRSVAGFAAALSQYSAVIVPTHPGFDGTPRPEWSDSVADLASGYLDLLDALDLTDVLVIGSSVGGWIAAEMALRDVRGRLRGLALIDAAGIAGPAGIGVADVSAMAPAALAELSFHQPALRPDFGSFTEEQRTAAAANQRTLAVYAGDPYMHDPKLAVRLHRIDLPVLVLWGEHDGVTPLAYGREFARLIPGARFVPVADSAHFPFVENPGAVFAELAELLGGDASASNGAASDAAASGRSA